MLHVTGALVVAVAGVSRKASPYASVMLGMALMVQVAGVMILTGNVPVPPKTNGLYVGVMVTVSV